MRIRILGLHGNNVKALNGNNISTKDLHEYVEFL